MSPKMIFNSFLNVLHSVEDVQQHTNNQNLTVVKFFILDIYSFFYK